MRVSHRFTAGSARFDEDNLVSDAGLVPLLGLAEQTRLPEIIAEKVSITTSRIKSGAANPAPKLLGVIAGMCAGADSIDDLDVLRAGGMPILFDGVYAPSTLGTLLREFSFGHARQLESVLREHLCALAERTELLAGIDEQAFIDIDSLLRPVYGHAKQGASYGHTKIAGKQVLRKGLSPLATTISTEHSCAGDRRDAATRGQDRLGQGSRADGRPGDRHRPRRRRHREDPGPRRLRLRQPRGGASVSARQRRVLPGHDEEPGHQPGPSPPSRTQPGPRSVTPAAVQDPDTGAWISDAEVAEVPYTAFAHTKDRITARLVVRRVKDARYPDALFPVWRYHPFFTNSTLPTAQADIVHRRHAIIETVFADLIDGPLAHLPSGHFGANSAWALCAAIAHNLLHAAGTLAGRPHTRARGATLRRRLIAVPARLARPARQAVLHLPSRMALGTRMAAAMEPSPRPHPSRLTPPRPTPARATRSVEELGRPAGSPRLSANQRSNSMIHNGPRS